MNDPLNLRSAAVLLVTVTAFAAGSAWGAVFTNSNRANVLRQLEPFSGVNQVSAVISGFGVQTAANSNEGSGSPDQWAILPSDGAQVGTTTYTLPGPRLVGSFSADFNGAHVPTGGFVLQGFSGGSWINLATVPAVTGSISGSFAPTSVTALRYNVTGPGTNDRYIQNA